MCNTNIFLGLTLVYLTISPASSGFSPGNRKGEVYVRGVVTWRRWRVDPERRTDIPWFRLESGPLGYQLLG
jgi:hypothetical protein